MSKIRILPEILSNKIAAGEVVERPASVVKELVENALDADSSRIRVEIERGGRSLIRVADNGIGMSRDDAMLAIERYATSKIFTDPDLFSIKTLGFRGEALPSIASVSRFYLVTREKGSDTATAIYVEGGKLKKVTEAGAPAGTMITVKHLFFNTPARRKFMKSIATEMGHIADSVSRMALGWPAINFQLYHNGKHVKSWSATSDPVTRVSEVLGSGIKGRLHELKADANGYRVSGWVCDQSIFRHTSRSVFIYINGRFVKDNLIQHALFEAYSGRLMKGQFPLAVLFISVPYDRVDVNVHPTKSQVRFAEPNTVHELVKTAVSTALKRADRPGWTFASTSSESRQPSLMDTPQISETGSAFHTTASEAGMPASGSKARESFTRNVGTPPQRENQPCLWGGKPFGDLRVIGQLYQTYILCESSEGLVLIDQHAAHERIRFEKLKASLRHMEMASQQVVVSETIDLSYREAEILLKLIPSLKTIGLEIEPFGGNTFSVKSVPALLEGVHIQPLIVEMVDKIAELGIPCDLEAALDRCLTVMACHQSVRANLRLSDTEIKALLEELDECENPSHCPHGRPIRITWSRRFLEKSFGRIV
ncbi:MAG: DNA mismatch repair endonuclease MutL [Deltaproteobacteria bacterium]|nr:DNA mismatch repair endonuclease MutL [Deltaproteobacteria bacterium]MBW2153437.1 DNA mismatch repair endonuclease MutL [Deltaproteobacteria bacterium]